MNIQTRRFVLGLLAIYALLSANERIQAEISQVGINWDTGTSLFSVAFLLIVAILLIAYTVCFDE